MKNLSVGLRLTIAFVLVSLFTTLVAVIGWLGVNETKSYLDNQTKIYIPSIDAVAKMRFNLRNLVVAQRTLLYPSLTDAERARQHVNFAAARDAYRKAIDAYAPLPQTPDEAVVWKQFEEALKPVVEYNNEVMRLIRKWEGDKSDQATLSKATEMVLTQGRDLNRTLNELIGKVFEINIKNHCCPAKLPSLTD